MLDPLLQQLPGVWRASSLVGHNELLPTGYSQLDVALGGGWPQAGLLEFLSDTQGMGELRMLLPLLRQLCVASPTTTQECHQAPHSERSIALWLNPPHDLSALALLQYGLEPTQHWISQALTSHNTLWAMEQALRVGACAIVIAWATRVDMTSLRRLKLAATTGRCLGVLYRPTREAVLPSPANLRAELHPHGSYLHLRLLKIQGRLPTSVMIELHDSHIASSRQTTQTMP